MIQRKPLSAKLAPLGPVALVTGASDGIGRATAVKLARKGFDLILVARRAEHLAVLSDDLSSAYGVEAHVLPADLATAEGVDAVWSAITKHSPGVAVLAAGFGTSGALGQADLDAELSMLDVNCRAVLSLSHELAAMMARRGSGQIVLFGSIVGFQGSGWTAHYSATKAYVQSLAEGLARELGPQGVHVLSVAPGPVHSGFAERAGMTMGAAGKPEQIARGIVSALGSSGTIRPGLLSKVLGYNMAMLPRPLRARLMTQIMSGMAKKNAKAAAAEPRA